MSRLQQALCAALLLAAARPAGACDSTGCLILTRGQGGLLRKGGFNFDFSYRYADMSKPLSGGEDAALVSRPRVDFAGNRLLPNYHRDVDGTQSGLQLEAAYGAAPKTTLYASAPLLNLKSHQVGHGSVVTQYDTWGFGDLVVGARQALGTPFSGNLVASVALKFPTGKTDLIDDFDGQPLDPLLQPGSGSLDVLLSAQFSRKLTSPRLDVALTGSYQANSSNGRGYRFGNEALASLALSRPLGRSFAITAQTKWMHEGRDGFAGQAVPSTGGTFVYLMGGLRAYHGSFSVYAIGQAPVYRYVNDSQLGPKAALLMGVSRAF
jgi:hypothetical protein